MSVLFYRRPDYLNKATGPINATECQRYVERAKNAERAIPPGLSFDEVINNKALPVSLYRWNSLHNLTTTLAMLIERLHGLPGLCRV
jgi:hypothetical protein